MKRALLLLAALPVMWGCADSTGPTEPANVAVRFTANADASVSASLAPMNATGDHVASTGAITLAGSNGTLVVEDIRLIVSKLELERSGIECEAEEDDDNCEKFEGGPFLVNLLDGTAEEVVTAIVPAGAYEEFEFKVEDLELDDDEDDESDSAALEALLGQMRQSYPEFPGNASAVVHGTFDGQPFTVYLDAEVEVEREFAVPFRVPEDGAILVNLDPGSWFMAGGEVVDLVALDGETIEFEAEFESGVEIEFDDDDDDDDDD